MKTWELKTEEERLLFTTDMQAQFWMHGEGFSYKLVAAGCNAVQFILEDLELPCAQEYISLREDIKLIGCFLKSVQETSSFGLPPQNICDLAISVVSAIDGLLLNSDSVIRSDSLHQFSPLKRRNTVAGHHNTIGNLVEEIRSVEMTIHKDDTFHGLTSSQKENLSGMDGKSIVDREILIGFEDEARELQDKLTRGRQQLQVISIVGMPGIGKTALARRLYNDLSVVYHFHTRAWVCVSQVYQKKKLLHSILSCILSCEDPIFHMNDEDIGEKLYKCLKGNRYLIVIDDVWDFEVWNELKIYFPEDDNFSRILMTSRIKDVVLKVRRNSFIHCLRAQTEKESWDLFNCKLFGDKSCPKELMEIANRIVAKCKGLPLAIVVIAGVLVREKNNEKCWRQVHGNMGAFITSNSKEFMNTLELSYKHLPSKLKSCFLYLGSFPEDSDIPVTRLFQSWIEEGFIQETDGKRSEHVAEDYLMDLVNRSLVMVAKRRSDGGIKSCNMHDMLRELCLKKTNEKKFVLPNCKCGPNATPFNDFDRLLMYRGHFPHFSHCQYFHSYNSHYVSESEIFSGETLAVYRFLNTLDLRHIIFDNFPGRILMLLHLRSLALQIDSLKVLPPTLFKLWNLETCILDGEKGGKVILPHAVFKMQKLRHLKISQELHLQDPRKCSTGGQSGSPQQETIGMEILEDHDHPSGSRYSLMEIAASLAWRLDGVLENLQSLSQICPAGFVNKVLERTPNLKKLGLHMTL